MDRVSKCTPATSIKYDPDHYRVVFFSSAPIGVPFLEKLATDQRFEMVWVVTQPDKPAGRGLHLQSNIIKTTAEKLCLPAEKIFTPEKINPEKSAEWKFFYENIKELKADFFVVIAYGKIVPQSILDLPRIGPINVHGSILPEYRWASPIQSVLLDEKTETGITIMFMDATLDTWDIISILRFPLSLSDTSREIIEKIQDKWPDFLANSLEEFAKGHLIRKPQDSSKSSLCSKMEKEDGLVDIFSDPLNKIFSKYKAFILRPKTFFSYEDKQFTIESLTVSPEIYATTKSQTLVDSSRALNPAISDITIKPEGKKAMNRTSFLNGYIKK